MTSQSGKQTIVIHIFLNISLRKGNQAMKLAKLIEYNKEIFFLKNYAENKAGRLVPDLFLFFKEA